MRRLLVLLLLVLAGPAFAQQPRLLDDFAAPAVAWRAQASDGVTGTMRPYEGGLRLDYDFSRGSGYAFLRRALPLELPANFELRFRLRGQGPANALEIKLTDASGENVWWHRRADYVPPGQWQTLRIRRRQIDFAWGPTTDRTLRRAAAIEFVVAAGSGGGRGWIAVDDLEIAPLPEPPAVPPSIIATADGGEGAALAVDGNRATAWTVTAAGAALILDLGYQHEFGGLVLRWMRKPFRAATAYEISLSADGKSWRQALTIRDGDGMEDWLQMPDSQARYIRIRIDRVLEQSAALAEVEVRPLAFGASTNALVAAVAANEPRGEYPRGFIGEQNYWTLVATPDGGQSGLIDEDGAIEVGRGGFSVEPTVIEGDRGWTWADTTSVQSLREAYLPIPTVERRGPGWRLTITAIAERHRLVARYRLRNDGAAVRTLNLILRLRPFQVNPPQQFLNITGGVSPIRSLSFDGLAILVNGVARVWAEPGASHISQFRFDSGPIEGSGTVSGDESGLATGWLAYDMTLRPGEAREVALSLGLDEKAEPLGPGGAAAVEAAAAARWREALGDVRITGPAAAAPIFDTLRTALAHVLATREGPALRPGSRAYARSWIRDGTMMSTALLRMGLAEPADRYLRWYAPFQYENGKVPCCVDSRGADPVPEHDSHGELIHLVAQLHRYAPDRRAARRNVAAGPRRRRSYRNASADDPDRGESAPAGASAPLRTAAAVDQPRGLFGQAGLQLLGQFLGSDGAEGRGLAGGRARPAGGGAAAGGAGRRLSNRPGRLHRRRPGPSSATASSPAPRTSAISTRPPPRSASAPAARSAGFPSPWSGRPSNATGRNPWRAATAPASGRTTRPTNGAMSGRWFGSAGATGRWPWPISSWPIAARPVGTNGPRWSGASPASRASSATCRTAGSRPTSSMRCSTCSPSNDSRTIRWSSAPGSPVRGWKARAFESSACAPRTARSAIAFASRRAAESSSYRLEGTPPPGGLVLHWMRGDIKLTGASGRRAFVL